MSTRPDVVDPPQPTATTVPARSEPRVPVPTVPPNATVTTHGRPAGAIAVLLPFHQRRPADAVQLEMALASLTDQGEALTIVVVDDGSPVPVVVPPTCPHPVILVRLARNRGITGALNAGLAVLRDAGFEYVMRLDAGDRCLPGRAAAQAAYLRAHPDCAVVGGAGTFVSPSGAVECIVRPPCTHDAIRRRLPRGYAFCHVAVMFRAAVVAELGGYDPSILVAEDYEYFWRMSRTHRVANLPDVVVVMVNDPTGISRRKRRAQQLATFRIRWQYAVWSLPQTYIGLARSLALAAAPSWIVDGAKRVLRRAA